MLWWIVIGLFTAFGILCAGLTLFGGLLHSKCQGLFLIDSEQGGEEAPYLFWLKAMGILKCRILILDSPELWKSVEEKATEITGWDMTAQPRTGAEEIDRPGNGDSPGNHQRGGISEL